ncbi:hypothetical protein JQ582_29770 [Bradyrhizobium japonicum]|jgi:hypothetical protein|uniref:hypothetical protein n=1 Tax=Bradyrhizobium TaxID=374 RepID=UPI000231C905|nr:hypothetical protein [Bradyrhizobium japonicum]AJA61923.1 hypothetical protein RN69_17415 [Bradyrhizobium japonicum]KMK00924.1 hypothetical protein CF64_01505 [Bradyrhizobium japonicum]MBR0730536.1 hypothetical protein [Bradyrhizobium japonicum]MBR0748129.1 hypothetical protein [Bradyrhizobium japonicum]MBR0759645.1 hypothetical protein [Bradyrhizobium japonicum]
MTRQYRAYLVGENGVFRSAEAFEADSDAAALRVAQQFTRRGDVEVWHLDRKIGLLTQATPPVAA